MTGDELKLLLQTPAALFLVMLLGSVASALIQLTDSRRNGAVVSCADYLKYWPETLSTLITNALAFALLVVTDQLNFGSALGIGYIANSASDLLRSGGRSAALAPATKQAGFASVSMLMLTAMLVAMAVSMVTACTTQQSKESAATDRALIETSVRIAVRHAVEDSPRAAEKAENIRRVLAKVQAIANADSTVAGLEALVREEVGKLELSPIDRADAHDLISLLAVALESRLQGNDAEVMDGFVHVGQFLDLVLSALPAPTAEA